MKQILCTSLFLALALPLLSGCAPKPKLSPNKKLNKVGANVATRDIENCFNVAKVEVEGVQGAVQRDAGAAAISSSAASASSGLVSGATSVGGVNVSGSATRGVRNALNSALTDRSDDPQFRKAVERCLRAKGYAVNGWG